MPGSPIVIAHRGASGYLPEHTLAAKALAHGMGADYLEQDIVATRDGDLIVFHDLTLDDMTDVARRFPGRARGDGRHYCIDFTLAELKTLTLRERRRPGKAVPRYAGRFADDGGTFSIPSLVEEIRFIEGLNRTTGRMAGLYAEIKHPAWHREQRMDVATRLLETLRDFGYTQREHAVFVQCVDTDELRRLRRDLGCQLRLIQLLEGVASGGHVPDTSELGALASYADGIGPAIDLIHRAGEGGAPVPTALVADAHRQGLLVHPYTFRADDLPAGFATLEALFDLSLARLQVDGVFTDFPDRARRFINEQLRWPLPAI